MNEHALQNTIRNALAGRCLLFRANTGTAWTGNRVLRGPQVVRLGARDVAIMEARPFNTGLPPGFADTFGLVPVVITPDMVGQTIGQFLAGEIKTPTGRLSDKQAAFLKAIQNNGGRADVWRSVEDALATVQGEESKK